MSDNDWASFDAAVSGTLDSFESRRGNSRGVSHPLFRGQADAEWKLRTTLERFAPQARHHKPWTIGEYYSLVRRVLPAVGSSTGKVWPSLDVNFNEGEVGPPPGYEFMIYLRHHGFPSPLLDWSRSPYVAAFFAFECQPHDGCEAVAVYSFQEQVGYGKLEDSDKARIIGLQSTTAPTDERHYSQQCEYTICIEPSANNRFIYASHDETLKLRRVPYQDMLTRYIIPTSARRHFLRKLESMNIHHYSLFGDEAALMRTLAYREIEKPEWNY